MANSALQPVAEAVFARLNVASLTAAYPTGAGCVGGVTEHPQQATVFPFLFYEVRGTDIGSLGQCRDVTEIELRLHVYSKYSGWLEARRIMRTAVGLLRYATLSVSGYEMPTLSRPQDEVQLPFEEINGVACKELVTTWMLFADEVAA